MDFVYWMPYIPIFVLFLILYLNRKQEQEAIRMRIVKRRNKMKGDRKMEELARRMLEKECIVYTFNGSQLTGTVKEVTEGAILLDNGKETEVVNLDFIVRIREYPKNKNGKKKSVIVD